MNHRPAQLRRAQPSQLASWALGACACLTIACGGDSPSESEPIASISQAVTAPLCQSKYDGYKAKAAQSKQSSSSSSSSLLLSPLNTDPELIPQVPLSRFQSHFISVIRRSRCVCGYNLQCKCVGPSLVAESECYSAVGGALMFCGRESVDIAPCPGGVTTPPQDPPWPF